MSGRRTRVVTAAVAAGGLLVAATPSSARTSYPAVVESLGTMGALVSHPDWYRGDQPPAWWMDVVTSHCAHGPTAWGVLTHPQGYEIRADGTYGDRQYVMYDAAQGALRPANVNEAGRLVPPSRGDRCAREPGRADPPDPRG